jgi:hypothetical protein
MFNFQGVSVIAEEIGIYLSDLIVKIYRDFELCNSPTEFFYLCIGFILLMGLK